MPWIDDPELTKREQEMTDRYVKWSFDFNDRKVTTCYFCGREVQSLRQVGRSVYANPCGCRLWAGGIPEAWK